MSKINSLNLSFSFKPERLLMLIVRYVCSNSPKLLSSTNLTLIMDAVQITEELSFYGTIMIREDSMIHGRFWGLQLQQMFLYLPFYIVEKTKFPSGPVLVFILT